MLIDDRLDVFLACASAGSFSRAGEKLSMTSTGVLKQINQLEHDLGMELFLRSHRGLYLTDAGRQLQIEAQELKKAGAQAMERIRAARDGMNGEIRIGTSPLTPPALMSDLWPKVQPMIPDLGFRLIPFDNNPQRAAQILSHLGEEIDVVAGFFDDYFLEQRNCDGLAVCSCSIGIGIPFGHPLWGIENLRLKDLYGSSISIIYRGWSRATDQLWNLLENTGQIELKSLDFFSSDALLKAINEKSLIVSFSIWNNIHPLLDIVEAEWTGKISYGFLHSLQPQGAVLRFLNAVRETAEL